MISMTNGAAIVIDLHASGIGRRRSRRSGGCRHLSRWTRCAGGPQEFEEPCHSLPIDIWESRHAAHAVLNGVRDLFVCEALVDVNERWKCGWCSGSIYAVTHRTLTLVYLFSRTACLGCQHKTAQPCHLVGVDVENICNRIKRGTAPLRATVEAGKNKCLLAHRKWIELTAVAKGAECLQRPFVRFRSAIRQRVFRELLPGKWLGKIG